MKNFSKAIMLSLALVSTSYASNSDDKIELELAHLNKLTGNYETTAHDATVFCHTCKKEDCFSRRVEEQLELYVGYQNMIVSDDVLLVDPAKQYALKLAQDYDFVDPSTPFDQLREIHRHAKGYYGIQQLLIGPDSMEPAVRSQLLGLVKPFLDEKHYPTQLGNETLQSNLLLKLDGNVYATLFGHLAPQDLSNLALTCRTGNNITAKHRGDLRALAVFRKKLLNDFHHTKRTSHYNGNAILTLIKGHKLQKERNLDWRKFLTQPNTTALKMMLASGTMPEDRLNDLPEEWKQSFYDTNAIKDAIKVALEKNEIAFDDFNKLIVLRYREDDLNDMLNPNEDDSETCTIF